MSPFYFVMLWCALLLARVNTFAVRFLDVLGDIFSQPQHNRFHLC